MDDSDLLPAFLTRLDARPKPEGDKPADPDDGHDELVAPGNAYAVARGPRQPPALKFLRTLGRSFALSYGYLPIPWWDSPDALLIEYPGLFTVSLTGRHLGELQARLCDHRVTWIREGGSFQPAAASVTRIAILRAYPSREEGAEPPGVS